MSRERTRQGLTQGLWALRLFAQLAPVNLSEFANAARLDLKQARALLATFEEGGYIVRVPQSGLMVLSALAMELPLICGCCALTPAPPATLH